jgi:poly-gamma-glutamate synthesis protein (capsule biosynthesis protein)
MKTKYQVQGTGYRVQGTGCGVQRVFTLYLFTLYLVPCVYVSAAQDTLTLVFAGDVMQHRAQLHAAQRGATYNYEEYFPPVKKYIDSADVAIANLEVTLAGQPYSGYPQFAAPDALAAALNDAGFDLLLTANNQACDKGERGIRRTVRALDSLGIAHTGTFRSQAERDSLYPMLWEKNNFRLAILNYTYGTNGIPTPPPAVVNRIDTAQIAADIARAKTLQPDVIIANMHWGDEYKLQPNAEQQALAEFLIGQGVRLVIGSHPHVVQRMERRYAADSSTHSVVVYSLGNFISNMSAKNTDGGVMAHIRLIKDSNDVRIDRCGYRFVWVYKPVVENQRSYQLLPVADFEHNPAWFTDPADFQKMNAFARAMRALYRKETIGFIEYK